MYTEWDIPPERERPELVASAADVRAALDKGDRRVQLLDARAAAQFTGVTQFGFSFLHALFVGIFGVRVRYPTPFLLGIRYRTTRGGCYEVPGTDLLQEERGGCNLLFSPFGDTILYTL